MRLLYKLLLFVVIALIILVAYTLLQPYLSRGFDSLYSDTGKGQLTIALIALALTITGGVWALMHWFWKRTDAKPPISQIPIVQPIPVSDGNQTQPLPPDQLLSYYYDDLIDQCQRYDLGYYRDSKKLSEQTDIQAALSDIYVDLEAHPVGKEEKGKEKNKQEFKEHKGLGHQETEPSKFLLEILGDKESHRMVLRGDVGSGKSSFINFLSYSIAASIMSHTESRINEQWLRRPVVRLLLREVGAGLTGNENKSQVILQQIRKRLGKHIENSLNARSNSESYKELSEKELDAAWKAFKPSFIKQGVLILDGLDEVSTEHNKRANLLTALTVFSQDKANQSVYIILTSRIRAYDGDDRLPGFNLYQLDNLRADKQVPAFIRHWYQHAVSLEDRQFSDISAKKLITKVQRPALQALIKTPLLLTLILVLDSTSIQLPESRGELYDNAVRLLLDRWHQQLLKYKKSLASEEQMALEILEQDQSLLEAAMRNLAFDTYEEAEGLQAAENEEEGSERTIVFKEALVEHALTNQLKTKPNMGIQAIESCKYFLRFRSQILKAQGNKLSFVHKSFHEYLAAQYILQDTLEDLEVLELISATHSKREWWRDVFLFALNIGKAKFVIKFIRGTVLPRQIASLNGDDLQNHLELINLCSHAATENQLTALMEREQGNNALQQVYADLQTYISGIWNDSRLSVEQKAQLGRSWGRFGDSRRPGISWQLSEEGGYQRKSTQTHNYKLPDIDWVTIPTGSFEMGSDDEDSYKDEKPIHFVLVNAFQMSRYPVTNAQYRCFVDAGGYDSKELWEKLPEAARWWREGGKADQKLIDSIQDEDYRERYRTWLADDTERYEPRYWNDPKWNLDNHPVVGVSWFEALAFVTWLNEQKDMMLKDLTLPNDQIRLPTEEEWEYAARGSENLKYAWGMDADKTKGNYADTGLSQTSPVGMFPESKAFGLQDMSGNVWEWTSSRWGNDISSPSYLYDKWKQEELAERNELDPVELRIIRGGSWYDATRVARCSIRDRNHPLNRNLISGFRLVYGVLPG